MEQEPVPVPQPIPTASGGGASHGEPGRRGSSFVRLGRDVRRLLARNRVVDATYRVVLGTVGTVLVLGGLVLVPLPGPGWLVVFAGLAVLGTEFGWARRAAGGLRRLLERFWTWWRARRAARRSARA